MPMRPYFGAAQLAPMKEIRKKGPCTEKTQGPDRGSWAADWTQQGIESNGRRKLQRKNMDTTV